VTNPNRVCRCGCGLPLNGRATQRYATEACRKRAKRHGDVPAAGNLVPEASHDGEKVLPALDRWLAEQDEDLPPPLVAAARALSFQVDATPRNGPLWGRLVTVFSELMAPALEARSWHVTQRQAIEQVALAGHDDRWRAAKYVEARDAGMDPTPWERVVPISCARDEHHWRDGKHQHTQLCQYCDTVRRTEEP
jgi:hypothetical protein